MLSRPIIINLTLFLIAWVLCTFAGAHHQPLLALVSVGVAVAIHLWRARRAMPELVLILITAWYGALWDGSLATLGWLNYPAGQFHAWIAPVWLIGVWALVATLVNVSLRSLKGRSPMAAGLGAFAGLVGYSIMERLGAVSFPDPLIAYPAIAIGWFFAGSFLTWLGLRLDGYDPRNSQRTDTA